MSNYPLLPNTTQIPNVILDKWMPHLTGAELRVVLYVARRTYGFGKESDAISINQMAGGIRKKDGTVLDEGTGLSRTSVVNACKALVSKKVLIGVPKRKPDGAYDTTSFRLNLERLPSGGEPNGDSKNIAPPPSQNGTTPSTNIALPLVQNLDLQNQVVQNQDDTVANAPVSAASPPPPKGEGKKEKKQNNGQRGIGMLIDRYNAAKKDGRKPLVLPDGVRKSLGGYVKQALSEGYSEEQVGIMCDYLVAVACGEVDERKRAWCGFGTAEEAIACGWRPRSKNGAKGAEKMPDEEWAEVVALMKEAGIA